jgi:hypothetical protein
MPSEARALFLSEVAERFDNLAPDTPSDDTHVASWAQEIEFVLSKVQSGVLLEGRQHRNHLSGEGVAGCTRSIAANRL